LKKKKPEERVALLPVMVGLVLLDCFSFQCLAVEHLPVSSGFFGSVHG
jgi:hypothetical protein